MNPDLDATVPVARTTLLTAITLIAGLLLGCATSDGPGNAAATSGTVPGYSEQERVAGPSERDKGYRFPVLPAGIALFRTLVSKPAARPLSSLHRLASFITSTTFDTLDPGSVLLAGRGPIPPPSRGRGMDLAAWERQLDELSGRVFPVETYPHLYTVYRPNYHTGEDTRWEYRIVVAYKNLASSRYGKEVCGQARQSKSYFSCQRNGCGVDCGSCEGCRCSGPGHGSGILSRFGNCCYRGFGLW